MKQSTKLLSLVLALVMAFSCMSVIGNAALVRENVKYDIIDDAALTAEQVADLALDLVDNDLLAGMDTIDLSILGELRLNKIDYIFTDITNLRDSLVWSIGKGLLGSIGDLDFDPLLQSGSYGLLSSHTAYQRSHGNLNVIYALLEFIGNSNNAGLLSDIAYGLGTDKGVSLGIIGSFLDLGDIGDMLGDIPHLLKTLVYDMLIYGSYGYDKDAEELGNVLPTSVDTLDKMINQAITGLLTSPQDYTWEGEGDAATKVWDMNSLISPTAAEKLAGDPTYFDLTDSSNSLFALIDKVAPIAIYDFGVNALNNNLKKALMEAVEIELNEIDVTSLPDNLKAVFEVDAEDGTESYCNYIAYDKMAKSGSTWYYTTMKSETIVDENDKPVLDEDGNEQSKRVRKFYKANMAGANDFASLINWDWNFTAPNPLDDSTVTGELNELDYTALVDEYGSITEMLNHLIYLVYENALTDEVKADFVDLTGDSWVDGPTSDTIMYNLERLGKYLLSEHADKIFGSDSPYVAWEYSNVEDKTITELVAIIGPTFFEDVMPQLVMPKDPKTGMYALHSGVELLEFGALVIREFVTEIAPSVNYDAYIFAEGTVTSVNDRQFAELSAEAWKDLILNMGMDIACTYLMNITNFEDYCTKVYGADFDLQGYISAGGGTDPAHWTAILDTAIMWAVNYVSDGTNSVLKGFEPSKVAAQDGPLNKLSYILNTLLPLGFVNGCTGAYDFDVSLLLDKIVALLTDFDLAQVASLFGRNQDSSYNAFDDDNILVAVLNIVNGVLKLVFDRDILVVPAKNSGNGVSLDTVVSQANLKTTVYNLLNALYTVGTNGLLTSALPVVGKLIKGWGTEQSFNPPQISLSRSIDLTNGATTEAQTVTIRNASDGVWRHYRDAAGNEATDNQYQIKPVSVNVYDQMSEDGTSAYVTAANLTTSNIDYGKTGSFTYTAANVPAEGALVRFKVGYKVIDEDNQEMANGKVFYAESYAWLNYNPTDEGSEIKASSESYRTSLFTPQYVGLSNALTEIPELRTSQFWRENVYFGSAQTNSITASTATVDGITFGNVSIKPANADYPSLDLYNFKTYSDTWYNSDGGDGKAFSVSGSINEAAWKAANKTPGSKSEWSVTLVTKNDTLSNQTLSIIYYDDVYSGKLATLAANEMDAIRLGSQYNLTGTVYANGILTSANSTDEEGETIFRDSNFNTLVWIDDDENEYADSLVADIVESTDEDGNVVAATGEVTNGEETISVKKVTKIDCATAINNYVAAFVPGIRGGMQAWNANSVYNHKELYEALYVAANDVQYCKKTTEQMVAEGKGDNIDAAVDTLKADLATIEAQYSDTKDYTDYKMYRWNRYNDARDDANYYINLKNDASNATVAEIDETFPYTWIEEDDLRALVKGDKYEANILALLEQLEGEELKAKAEWLENRKLEYQSQSLLDVEMAASYLNRVAPRLLAREHGVQTKYLADEITSAKNMIGTANNGRFTERSWTKYAAALADAEAVLAKPTQMTVFDAKWELLCCRNELVKVGEEADYSELETLIAQAEQALANQNLYDNTAKDFGMVLAELGYKDFTNADGDKVQLFPGSAIYTNTEPYTTEDQDIIDDAARQLKEALGRLNFKDVTVTYKSVEVSTGTLVEADEENGIEEVTTRISRIDSEKSVDAIKALFAATGAGINVAQDDITITNDIYYSVKAEDMVFVGTNATVTFYTKSALDGVMIPVATVKLIVDGDINGDGAVDVLDAAYATLVSQDKGQLEGCYLLAGDLEAATDREIAAGDVSAIVNIALGR